MPIAHGLLGASIIAAVHPQPAKRYFAPFFIGILLANAADFDFFLVLFFESRVWHRGFTHSILFALLVCLIFIMVLGKKHIRTALAFGLSYASHCLLDFATTKDGGGVELFWFFSSERWQLGLVELSESATKLPLVEVVRALFLETLLFIPVFVLMLYLRRYLRPDWSKAKDSI